MLVGRQHAALARHRPHLLIQVDVHPLDRLLRHRQHRQHVPLGLGQAGRGGDLLHQLVDLLDPPAGVLPRYLYVPGVDLDLLGGIGGLGGQLRVVHHALDVAVLLAVLQQAEAVAGVLDLAVAVDVVRARALDDVGDVLGVDLHQPQVAGCLRVAQELGVAQQLVRLLAQPEREAELAGRDADADQHVPHMHQRLRRQRAAGHHVLRGGFRIRGGRLRDVDRIERAEQVLAAGRHIGE
jgi:hypothetical protein